MTGALNNRRTWLAGGVVAAAVLVALSWFLLIGPQLSAASSARAAQEDAASQNDRLRTTISSLKKQNENLPGLTRGLGAALAQLPTDTALPQFSREVNAQAQAAGIQVTSITVADPTAANQTAADQTAADQTAADQSADPTGQANASVAGQVLRIPVTIVTAGPADAQAAFLKALQYSISRRILVTAVSLTPGEGGAMAGTSTMTIQGTLFFTPETVATQQELQRLLAGNVSR